MRTPWDRWWLGALSLTGVVATHAVAYVLVEPHHGARDALLDGTGHRFFPVLVGLGLAALVAGLSGVVARAGAHPANGLRLWPTAWRLAALQGSGWLLLELGERVAVAPHGTGLADRVVLAGLAVQVLVAVAGAVILALLHRAVAGLCTRRRRGWPATRRTGWLPVARVGFAVTIVGSGGATLRGPPAR